MKPQFSIPSSANLTALISELASEGAYAEKIRKTPLDNYLSALWHITQSQKEVPQLSYDLIADLLMRALDYSPMPYDWGPHLKREYAYQWETLSAPNTPEYFAEIKTHAFFERRIRRQITDLKRINHVLPLPSFVRWENKTVEGFLERGTYSEDEDEDKDETLNWGDFSSILGQGQWAE